MPTDFGEGAQEEQAGGESVRVCTLPSENWVFLPKLCRVGRARPLRAARALAHLAEWVGFFLD